MNLEQNFYHTRKSVRDRMTARNSKHVYWLKALEHSGFIFRDRDKGRMFEADYLWMREVDDVVDGHLELPPNFDSRESYVTSKRKVLAGEGEPTDAVDGLIALCTELSQRAGIDLTHERDTILLSMLFDAQRFGTGTIYPRSVLQEYFYRCDIEGTARGTLKMFETDAEKHTFVEPLGIATRIHYNLRDYEEDIGVGYVNIPAEDCERFGISSSDLAVISSPGVHDWFQFEAQRGMACLEKHDRIIGDSGFSRVGRGFIRLYHYQPAHRFFQRVLAGEIPGCGQDSNDIATT